MFPYFLDFLICGLFKHKNNNLKNVGKRPVITDFLKFDNRDSNIIQRIVEGSCDRSNSQLHQLSFNKDLGDERISTLD